LGAQVHRAAAVHLGAQAHKKVQIDATQLTNSTTLEWAKNTEPDLKGYEIVWRATTDPDWTHVIPVGKKTRGYRAWARASPLATRRSASPCNRCSSHSDMRSAPSRL
jgi:hypothetical protein